MTPQPSFVAALPPMPALPAIGGTVLVSTSALFEIAPGTTRLFEASTLAQERGVSAPACPGVAWVAAWRATDALTGTVRTDTSRFDLGRGRWGTADMSCATLELRNDTATVVAGELAFTIASR